MLGRGVCVNLAPAPPLLLLLLLHFGLITCFQNETVKSNVTFNDTGLFLPTPRADRRDIGIAVERGSAGVEETKQKVSDTQHIKPGE